MKINEGAPGWLSWLSSGLLISVQVMILGSWDQPDKLLHLELTELSNGV